MIWCLGFNIRPWRSFGVAGFSGVIAKPTILVEVMFCGLPLSRKHIYSIRTSPNMFLRPSIIIPECQGRLRLGKGSQNLTKGKASIRQCECIFTLWHGVSGCTIANASGLLKARLGQILLSMDLERKWSYIKSWLLRVCPSMFLFLH